LDEVVWNSTISSLPGANILQTWEWAQLKAANGWAAQPKVWQDEQGRITAAAMILRRQVKVGGIAAPLSVLYIPRGPLLAWGDVGLRRRVLDDLQSLARQSGAIFIKMDPEIRLGTGVAGEDGAVDDPQGLAAQADLTQRGWRFSLEQIQFRNTLILDVSQDEEVMLARMKQKARYNLRLAQRKGVHVRRGTDADYDLLYRMYAETAVRDGFVIRAENYYRTVWEKFSQAGMCFPLIAEVEGEAVAGLVLFVFAGRAWYLYGMSREAHREKMPNYLLQWEAMRLAHDLGAQEYDLWGAPDTFDETDSMWGVYRFKEGLGGMVIRTPGAWDYTSRSTAYTFYTRLLPRILDIMRRRGKERTRREVGA
jgi:peptidoglycan pentaglycine glycine transferase (the first glycine)